MKILIVGSFYADIYEASFVRAFEQLGHDVSMFNISLFFGNFIGDNRLKKGGKSWIWEFYYRFQSKFLFGPALFQLNEALTKQAIDSQPDLIFIYRGTQFFPSTLQAISRKTNAKIYGYNNDDPFSTIHPKYLWRHFVACLPFYDHVFAYRYRNLEQYAEKGLSNISLLRSYFIKSANFPISNLTANQYQCDVTFIGHYEADGRDEAVLYLAENGVNIKLYGTLWQHSPIFEKLIPIFGQIKPVYADYNLALNSAKIALVFFSKKNNDTYTRRCFEIPAAKTFMMSEYSDDLSTLFEAGKEADYFKNKEELLQKVQFYLSDKAHLDKVTDAGYARLLKDKHEVTDRAAQVIEIFEQIKNLSKEASIRTTPSV